MPCYVQIFRNSLILFPSNPLRNIFIENVDHYNNGENPHALILIRRTNRIRRNKERKNKKVSKKERRKKERKKLNNWREKERKKTKDRKKKKKE